jgi:hypothetical protein
MNTDDLVKMLAAGGAVPQGRPPEARFAAAVTLAAVGALALMAGMLGVRADLAQAAALPMFWGKLGFGIAVAVFALPLGLRLARPGARVGWPPAGIALVVGLLWLMAVVTLAQAAPGDREALVFGRTWLECPFNIAVLSVPGFVALLKVNASLAPTRPALAGAAAGLLSAAVAAAAYTLHCPELDAPFLAVWYVLGMLIPTAAGALLGPRLLRW